MKMVKGLLLGTAAGLAAMTGAQAADLPVKAKAVEYVKICSLYGAGFYYIPGTDTCIKFGGYLRVDATVHGNVYNGPAWNGSNGANDRFAHDWQSRSRLAFTVDARTATQYGVVRIFGQTDWQFSTFGAGGGLNGTAIATAAGVGAVNNDTPGNGYVAVEQVFVQFAGFTFGKSISARAMPWNGYMGNNNSSFFIGGPDYVTGVNNVQYTYQWGNGVSTSIGVDEPVVFNRTVLGNTSAGVTPLGTLGNTYAGQSMPDIVANFKIDQAWGIFTVAGNVHEVKATYYTPASELSGHPGTKYGYSVTGGLQLKADAIAPGDRFTVDATYAKGDTKAVIATSAASPSFAIFGQGITGATYQSLGFGFTSDGVYTGTNTANGTAIQLTTAYGVRAAFIHNWNAQWQSSLWGSYSAVRYNNTAANALCASYGRAGNVTGLNVTYTCDPDFNVAQIGFRTGWTPVAGLTFSMEYLYVNLDQKFTGTGTFAVVPSAALAKPAANYNFKDQDTHSINFRVQRNF
ncbi:MAG: porin [Pseudomonadota bacterium]